LINGIVPSKLEIIRRLAAKVEGSEEQSQIVRYWRILYPSF